MNYQQVHAGKIKLNGLGGIQHHLLDRDKVRTNPDIDLSRSHLNHSIENLSPDNLATRVRQRISLLHLKRKPRLDAVGLEDVIVSATGDFMLNTDEEARQRYFSDALHFFQQYYGAENVMYCYCHMDESKPHIHIGIVPVTPDGRLSARDLFSPKSLEKLQTDFHREVAQHYGLERGEHHSQSYLELNKFKVRRTQSKLQQYARDLQSVLSDEFALSQIAESAHFASTGLIFTAEDNQTIQLPTANYLQLKKIAEEGLKAVAVVNAVQDDNQKIKHKLALCKSDLEFFLHQLHKLEKDTASYRAIPKAWRPQLDADIKNLQEHFTRYCHAVHRLTTKTFIITNGDLTKTAKIMESSLKNIGITDVQDYIRQVVKAARKQILRNTHPEPASSSWKPPSPFDTDYRQADDDTAIIPLQLSEVPDIDWTTVNWDLLSEIDKESLRHTKLLREI